MRLGAGKDLVDRELFPERHLADPFFFIDALALDHRYLSRRAAPGETAELEEADEDRSGRLWRAWGRGLSPALSGHAAAEPSRARSNPTPRAAAGPAWR